MKILKRIVLSLILISAFMPLTSCEGHKVDNVIAGEDEIVLQVSKKLVAADGEDEVSIKVKLGNTDVTAESRIYVGKESLSDNTFSTNEPGKYELWASYKTKISEKVYITAYDTKLKVDIPEDPQPEKFSNFKHKILVTDFTGTWCQYCPLAAKAIDMYTDAGPKRANVEFAAVHSGDKMATEFTTAAARHCSVTAYPTVCYNLDPAINTPIVSNFSLIHDDIDAKLNLALTDEAGCGISAATNIASGVLSISAQLKFAQDGNYRMNVLLLEDGLVESQTGAESVGYTNPMTHNHVVRYATNVNKAYGDAIGDKKQFKKGDIADYYIEISLDKVVYDTEKTKVLFIVSKLNKDEKYTVSNCASCHIGEALPYIYE